MTQRGIGDIRIMPVTGMPEIEEGADLAKLILQAAHSGNLALLDGDIVVVTQKAVSKAEGRMRDLRTVTPSPFAEFLASQHDKDPRVVEVVLQESKRIVKMDRGLIIAETHHGLVCANAGVDHSNLPDDNMVCLLPVDPDASAERLRLAFDEYTALQVAVLITDSFGRPWRDGITEVAIGLAGMAPVVDYRGGVDAYDRPLRATVVAFADEVAAAAGLVMEKRSGVPAAVVRGFRYEPGEGGARALVMPQERDLFR